MTFIRQPRGVLSGICLRAAIALAFTILLPSCARDPVLSSIQIVPSSATLPAAGDTIQFKAIGTFTKTGHPSHTEDITTKVTWASASPAVATVSATGLATAIAAGTVTVTATMSSSFGPVTASADLTSKGGVPETQGGALTALTLIPTDQIMHVTGETTQYIAIGTFNSSPIARDMTQMVTWHSSDVLVATINSTGLATAVGNGIALTSTTITAEATSTSGETITASVPLSDDSSGGVTLPSLAVCKVGLGTGTVTSSPPGINCGPTASCTGNFVLGSSVALTATPLASSTFGGWSSNCTPSTSATCTVTMANNENVCAIFN